MRRKSKFSKELKIKACENCDKGKGSFKNIAESMSAGLLVASI